MRLWTRDLPRSCLAFTRERFAKPLGAKTAGRTGANLARPEQKGLVADQPWEYLEGLTQRRGKTDIGTQTSEFLSQAMYRPLGCALGGDWAPNDWCAAGMPKNENKSLVAARRPCRVAERRQQSSQGMHEHASQSPTSSQDVAGQRDVHFKDTVRVPGHPSCCVLIIWAV